MKRLISRAALIFVAALSLLALDAYAQSQYGCPHSAAKPVHSFRAKTSNLDVVAERISSASQSRWTFAATGLDEVPALLDDGALDAGHPFDTHLISYFGDPSKPLATYWFHEFNRPHGSVVHSHGKQRSEGVDNLDEIRGDIGSHRVLVVENNNPRLDVSDIASTHVLIGKDLSVLSEKDFRRVVQVNDRFLARVSSTAFAKRALEADGAAFVTSAAVGGSELIVLYKPVRTLEGGRHWVGTMFLGSRDTGDLEAALRERLGAPAKGARVFAFGDPIRAIDLTKIADQQGVEITYVTDSKRDFIDLDGRLIRLSNHRLEPSTTAFLNAVPSSAEELRFMGNPESDAAGWQKLHGDIETAMEGKYGARIRSKNDFLRELQSESSDVLTFVAHGDGKYLYLGRERLSLAEIETLPSRAVPSDRPRMAIVISCNSGSLNTEQRSLFRRSVTQLAALITSKGFVDVAVAPDHSFGGEEAKAAVAALVSRGPLSALRAKYPGWLRIAQFSSGRP